MGRLNKKLNKEEFVKNNEEMQIQTSMNCAKLSRSSNLKKPKQVKLNIKKVRMNQGINMAYYW